MSNWRHGREKYGKIRSGQFWKKKDSGMVMRIKNKNGGDRWTVEYNSPGHRVCHTIAARIIYHYYDLVT